MLSSGGLTSVETMGQGVQGAILREIDDPNTGDRWLLMRDEQHPGGPGRMVLVGGHRNGPGGVVLAAGQAAQVAFLPVIRSGDRLIVEEHTARVDAVFEARAISPAALGSAFDARLTIGGNVVRVVAMGPGRATLQVETRVRP
jgi:hypothetical protein